MPQRVQPEFSQPRTHSQGQGHSGEKESHTCGWSRDSHSPGAGGGKATGTDCSRHTDAKEGRMEGVRASGDTDLVPWGRGRGVRWGGSQGEAWVTVSALP